MTVRLPDSSTPTQTRRITRPDIPSGLAEAEKGDLAQGLWQLTRAKGMTGMFQTEPIGSGGLLVKILPGLTGRERAKAATLEQLLSTSGAIYSVLGRTFAEGSILLTGVPPKG